MTTRPDHPWPEFVGLPGTSETGALKAHALAPKLVQSVHEATEEMLQSLTGEFNVGWKLESRELPLKEVFLEAIYMFIQFIDRLPTDFSVIGTDELDTFMPTLIQDVQEEIIQRYGSDIEPEPFRLAFTERLDQRRAYYCIDSLGYDAEKGTVLLQFGKRIADILGLQNYESIVAPIAGLAYVQTLRRLSVAEMFFPYKPFEPRILTTSTDHPWAEFVGLPSNSETGLLKARALAPKLVQRVHNATEAMIGKFWDCETVGQKLANRKLPIPLDDIFLEAIYMFIHMIDHLPEDPSIVDTDERPTFISTLIEAVREETIRKYANEQSPEKLRLEFSERLYQRQVEYYPHTGVSHSDVLMKFGERIAYKLVLVDDVDAVASIAKSAYWAPWQKLSVAAMFFPYETDEQRARRIFPGLYHSEPELAKEETPRFITVASVLMLIVAIWPGGASESAFWQSLGKAYNLCFHGEVVLAVVLNITANFGIMVALSKIWKDGPPENETHALWLGLTHWLLKAFVMGVTLCLIFPLVLGTESKVPVSATLDFCVSKFCPMLGWSICATIFFLLLCLIPYVLQSIDDNPGLGEFLLGLCLLASAKGSIFYPNPAGNSTDLILCPDIYWTSTVCMRYPLLAFLLTYVVVGILPQRVFKRVNIRKLSTEHIFGTFEGVKWPRLLAIVAAIMPLFGLICFSEISSKQHDSNSGVFSPEDFK